MIFTGRVSVIDSATLDCSSTRCLPAIVVRRSSTALFVQIFVNGLHDRSPLFASMSIHDMLRCLVDAQLSRHTYRQARFLLASFPLHGIVAPQTQSVSTKDCNRFDDVDCFFDSYRVMHSSSLAIRARTRQPCRPFFHDLQLILNLALRIRKLGIQKRPETPCQINLFHHSANVTNLRSYLLSSGASTNAVSGVSQIEPQIRHTLFCIVSRCLRTCQHRPEIGTI